MNTPLVVPAADQLEELASALRRAQKAHRAARKHKAQVLQQLSLAEIAEREARTLQQQIEDQIYTLLGASPKPEEPISHDWRAISWDEVWCPRCKHTFLPSQPGGGRRV